MGGYPLALVLAALAGSVDALAFLHWGGLFVSFMSGNSTILGAHLAGGAWAGAAMSLAIIGAFVGGVVLGETADAMLGRHAQAGVLAGVAVLLAAAAAAMHAGCSEATTAPFLGAGMGVQNAVLHRAAGINVALTYVTGTLVQAGRAVAAALLGRAAWAAMVPFLGLWCSLLGGSVLGALAAMRSVSAALAVAAAVAALLAGAVAILTRRVPREQEEYPEG